MNEHFQRPLSLAVFVALGLLAPAAAADERAKRPAKPNVLFIAVDDLNHWVHYLGRNTQVKTSNLDRIAWLGVRFTHAYCAARPRA